MKSKLTVADRCRTGFFGGASSYSIGVSASTSEEEMKYFELELSRREVLSKYKDNEEIIASRLLLYFL